MSKLALAGTKHKDRLGSYPYVPLCCVIASGHRKTQLCEYYHIMQARRNATHAPLCHIVNWPLQVT